MLKYSMSAVFNQNHSKLFLKSVFQSMSPCDISKFSFCTDMSSHWRLKDTVVNLLAFILYTNCTYLKLFI